MVSHIVGMSGGKDSTALGVRLNEVEPRDYEWVMTPTGDELPEMYDHWNQLSQILGKPLTVLTSGRSLSGLIREQNTLPSWRMRWCTRMLKLEPYKAYLANKVPVISYVGLRADEDVDDRTGMVLSEGTGITTRFPLREWGWGIGEVLGYLEEKGITIPERTDCARCFFQRLPEWWRLYRDHPDLYEDACAQEAATGHTFRSPGRDTQPAALTDLRAKFDRGYIPKGAAQLNLMDTRKTMCRACSL